MNQTYLRRIYWRLTGVIMLLVIGALAANSYLSHRNFEQALVPELEKKAVTVGASVRALMLKAVEYRIPFRELYGVDQTFREVVEENADFAYMAVTDTTGRIIYQGGEAPQGVQTYFRRSATLAKPQSTDVLSSATRVGKQDMVSLPISAQGEPLGALHIGIDVRFVDKIVVEMLYDVVVILVVALFFTLELLNFIAGARLEAGLRSLAGILERGGNGDFTMVPTPASGQEFGEVRLLLERVAARVNAGYLALTQDIERARRDPAHDRQEKLGVARAGLQDLDQRFRFGPGQSDETAKDACLAQVRAPLFAFILAEELTRSFLPTYVNDLLVPIPGLSPQIVVGLPIVLFMLIVALGQPYLGAVCERIGFRRAMMYGAGIATVGFAATALAANVLDLLLWRSLCALGYAMVFVAAQGYVLLYTTPSNRARGFSLFVGAIMVATVCGPSVGGILADNVGIRTTFAIAALIALGSILAIRTLPKGMEHATAKKAARPPRFSEITTLMINPRFMTLTGLAAIPAKVILIGVCFYLIPLYMVSVGSTQAMAGRALMTYGVLMVLLGPWAASLATSRRNREWLVAGGLIASGLGGLMMLAGGSVVWVFAAVVLIGFGQSLSISAQSALVSDHCKEEIARMGEGTVYGVYRLLERMGNALGPLVAAGLVTALGYHKSFIAFGALVMVCGIAFTLATQVGRGPAPATATAG